MDGASRDTMATSETKLIMAPSTTHGVTNESKVWFRICTWPCRAGRESGSIDRDRLARVRCEQ